MRTEGHAVESICRVLREQGCQIAARTYRQWAGATRPVATRTITDAIVTDRVRDLVWTVDHAGVRRMTPEGLYGRRKMTALVKRADADTSPGSVDRAMRTLGLQGVRRAKGVRTTIPAKDGTRAGDLLDRDFTAEAPNRTWVMDFTYVRTWAGFVYVAFVLDVFAQKIVAWNVAATKAVELVDVPVRMALWQRGREGHPVVRGELIGHADAGSQYTSITFTDHLADEGIRPGGTLEKLGSLKTPFKEDGVISAGNASQISDGGSATLVASESAVKAHGLKPRARIHHISARGDDPVFMLTGPIPATKYALAKTGLTMDDIDVVEINEAFAPVVLAWAKELDVDLKKVNPNGGAIALGHPLGATGAKLFATMLNELERTGGKYGLQTMCEGGGQANATIIELL